MEIGLGIDTAIQHPTILRENYDGCVHCKIDFFFLEHVVGEFVL
jgi:hypothetical protein